MVESGGTILRFDSPSYDGSGRGYLCCNQRFRSVTDLTNGGGSWQSVNNGLGLQYQSVLVTDSSNNIYTGNLLSGLYMSTDKGSSWSKTNLVGDVQCVAAISGNRVCVGGRQTVSISNDFGKTWSSSQVTADSRVEVSSIARRLFGKHLRRTRRLPAASPSTPLWRRSLHLFRQRQDMGILWNVVDFN